MLATSNYLENSAFDALPVPEREHPGDFARDFLQGLAQEPRSIPPKYFYDAEGSALFDRICALPEYYPARTEIGILESRASEISAHMGAGAEVVEFGAGSLEKVRILFDALRGEAQPRRYVPIDISGEHLDGAVRRLRADYPSLDVEPIVADYTRPMLLPRSRTESGKRVGFFPGSTIGNLLPDEALAFLQTTARLLRGGGLLIGVDLVKEPARLHAAYNDAEGVTGAFNLNLLRRANRELEAQFDVDAFAHYAFYNPVLRRVEMHLVSRRAQVVSVCGTRFAFAEGGTLHTENSHKFTIGGFRALAARAGYRPGPVWTDRDDLFSVHWLDAPARL